MLDRQTIRELLDYDPLTGIFRWRRRDVSWFKSGKQTAQHNCAIWNGKFAGEVAGSKSSDGYHDIRVLDDLIEAHRLAWFYMTGMWPSEEIDHKDRDRSNNRWRNLREATHGQNGCNTKIKKNNTSGFKGVHRHRGGWRARISLRGKSTCLGVFSSPKDAHAAYVKAAAQLHGEFASAG